MTSRTSSVVSRWVWPVALVLAVGIGWGFREQWLPMTQQWIASQRTTSAESASPDEPDDHSGHDHAGHDDSTSLELSAQALRNIGLSSENVRPIKLESFNRTLSVPAMVVERPGRTKIKVVAPMTGIITDVYAIKGEAVLPATLLFKLRLTHEELVQAQTVFLKTLGELDVEKREIERLQEITERGVVAGKVLLERQYAKEKLEAVLSAHREALLLHGFSLKQVEQIVTSRHLLGELLVKVPVLRDGSGEVRMGDPTIRQISATLEETDNGRDRSLSQPFVIQELNVSKGEFVQAGDTLCVLADYRELYIEGHGFEQDADDLVRAAQNDWMITAVREGNGSAPELIHGLKVVFIDNEIEADSRALRFYVRLPNEVLRDAETSDGRRFLTWRYKTRQRMQLLVPVEQWDDRIVLPVDAVAQEGAEYFVFQQNGDHFDRRPVHVEYRDQFSAVIANDGSLFPGDTVAFAGAHQMQVALKNKAGGAVDPHAGHSHSH